jgi:hypothetical protein
VSIPYRKRYGPLRSPARLHAAPVLNGSLPGHLYARRCGYTLHWSSTGSLPWATLRSSVRLHSALALDGVTPLGAARDAPHTTSSPQVCAPGELLPTAAKRRWAALFVLQYGALVVDASMNGALGRRRAHLLRRHPSLHALARPSCYRRAANAARALARLGLVQTSRFGRGTGRIGRRQRDARATLRTRRAAADRREAGVGQRSPCSGKARPLRTRRMASQNKTKDNATILEVSRYWKVLSIYDDRTLWQNL